MQPPPQIRIGDTDWNGDIIRVGEFEALEEERLLSPDHEVPSTIGS
jgi:hypothetical protein